MNRYAPLFEDFHEEKAAWTTLLIILFKQYLLSMVLAFSVVISGCPAESIAMMMLLMVFALFLAIVQPYTDPLSRVLEVSIWMHAPFFLQKAESAQASTIHLCAAVQCGA